MKQDTWPQVPELNAQQFEELQKVLIDNGVLKPEQKVTDVNAVVDMSFVKKSERRNKRMAQIELKDVCLSYFTLKQETEAIRKINMAIGAGEFISIVGPSGCGKSTMLSLISACIDQQVVRY